MLIEAVAVTDAPMKLSQRLRAVAAFVLPGQPLADVGTDHGRLPVALLLSEQIPSALAMDLRPTPLDGARRLAARCRLGAPRFQARLSDGLAALAIGEVATVSICGMGGALIEQLLSAQPAIAQSIERLVLQPNTSDDRLRRWLLASGWEIIAEALIEERGRFYPIIAAQRRPEGQPVPSYSAADLAFGAHILRDAPPSLLRRLEQEQRRLAFLTRQSRHAADPDDPDRLRLLALAALVDAALLALATR